MGQTSTQMQLLRTNTKNRRIASLLNHPTEQSQLLAQQFYYVTLSLEIAFSVDLSVCASGVSQRSKTLPNGRNGLLMPHHYSSRPLFPLVLVTYVIRLVYWLGGHLYRVNLILRRRYV